MGLFDHQLRRSECCLRLERTLELDGYLCDRREQSAGCCICVDACPGYRCRKVFTKGLMCIWTHCCWNIFAMVFFVMSYFGVWDVSQSSYPSVIRVENTSATVISCVLAIVGVAILWYKKYAKVKN